MGDVYLDYDLWLNIICIKYIYILIWIFEKEKRVGNFIKWINLIILVCEVFFFIFLCVDDWILEIEREKICDKGFIVSYLLIWIW